MELQIERLSKRYGERQALREVSLCCEPGVLGLVGPNGAGKTTLMRIAATLIAPTAGVVRWDGLDVRERAAEVRRGLGYLPQDFGVYPEFTARQFLRYFAALKGLVPELGRRRVDEVLEMVNLGPDADRRLGGYSGGMKQRVGIAQALLNDPRLLIVDEPTAGLDPVERVRFRTLLAGLSGNRLTILSSHVIGDVEAIANRLAILREGRLVLDTTPSRLLAAARGSVWTVVVDPASAARLQAAFAISGITSQPAGVQLRIVSRGRPHESAAPVEPNLEDAYLLAVAEQTAGASA